MTSKSDTVTNTDVRTTKVTSTRTSTATVAVTPIKTKPTPAGFTPISKEVGYVPRRKRGLSPLSGVSINNNGDIISHKRARQERAASYPEAVNCREIIETGSRKTYTNNDCVSTKTTTLPARSTATQTTTVTPTSRNPKCAPYITSTITLSEFTTTTTSLTKTSTATRTRTITVTSTAPTVTFYAACATNNIVNHANGNQPISFVIFGDANPEFVSASTPYDCCVLCQKAKGCLYSYFVPGLSPDGCGLVIADGPCDTSIDHNTIFYTNPEIPIDDGFVLSNGPCGYVPNGGTNIT